MLVICTAARQAGTTGRTACEIQQQRSSEDAGPADSRSTSLRPGGVRPRAALDRHSVPPRPTRKAAARPAGGRLGAAQHRSGVHPKTTRHYRRTNRGVI